MTILTHVTLFRGYFRNCMREFRQDVNFALVKKGNILPLERSRLAMPQAIITVQSVTIYWAVTVPVKLSILTMHVVYNDNSGRFINIVFTKS